MHKQSPIRSHRSKGIKVKHIVQICLLLAVCFWLIYQVKHSQEKRKEFDAKDGKDVGKVQSDSDIQILGRKGHPRVTSVATDVEQHDEDEEEKESEEGAESKHEEEESEKDDNKHEEDEPEKDDSKHEEEDPEKEDNKQEELDERRGGGDDEIDENETERTDAEPEHEEESVDEDNDRVSEERHTERVEIEDLEKVDGSESEENEDARKEEHTKTEENKDVKRDESESNTRSDDQVHEARDAQYKADDASSEVAQNTQTLVPETGNFTIVKGSEMFGKVVNFGEGNETQTSDKDDSRTQSAVLQPREDIMNNSASSSNATATDEIKYDIRTDKWEETPSQNSTLPNDQTDHRSNSTTQSTTGEGEAREGETGSSKPELAEVGPDKTENVNRNTTADHFQKTNETGAMATKEDSSLHVGEKSHNNVTSGSDEGLLLGDIQHVPIGQSNISTLTRESRMDLGLPQIQTEVQSNIDAVAE